MQRRPGPVAADAAKGSPAEKAGLKAGDLIIGIERSFIDSAVEFKAALEAKSVGSELRLRVVSGGRERRVTLVAAQVRRVPARAVRPHDVGRPVVPDVDELRRR